MPGSGGLLAGSPLPGTRHMIFCGYSPQWDGFYVSALGGAMYVFHRFGVNYVWVRGRCLTRPSRAGMLPRPRFVWHIVSKSSTVSRWLGPKRPVT